MRKYVLHYSNSDLILFLKHWVGKVAALIVYADDMTIVENDVEENTRLQEQLSTEF